MNQDRSLPVCLSTDFIDEGWMHAFRQSAFYIGFVAWGNSAVPNDCHFPEGNDRIEWMRAWEQRAIMEIEKKAWTVMRLPRLP